MYKVDTPKKKPWYKRWKVWGYTWGAIILIGWIIDLTDGTDANEAEIAEEVEVKTESKAPVVAVKTPEEVAAEAEVAAIKEKVDEERRIAESAAKEKKAAESAKVKAETDAKAKVVADAKKAEDKAAKAEVASSVQDSLQALIVLSDGVVTDVKKSPYGNGTWETTWVVVSDAWYNSAEHEKERFAESVGDAVRLATNGEAMLVHFYDAYDKQLAKEKVFGGYEIKR